jgi:hypothetical protein
VFDDVFVIVTKRCPFDCLTPPIEVVPDEFVRCSCSS